MNVVCFTHTDFDGVTGEIITRAAFPNAQVQVYRLNYADMYAKMESVLAGLEKPEDTLFIICDLAIRQTTQAESLLDQMITAGRGLIFAEHHWDDSKWVLDFAQGYKYSDDNPTDISIAKDKCGAMLLYEILKECSLVDIYRRARLAPYERLVFHADDYDCWKHTNPHSKRLNNLLYLLGEEAFIERFVALSYPGFDEAEELLVSTEEKKRQRYIDEAVKRVKIMSDYSNTTCLGLLYVSRYTSEVGHAVLEKYPHLTAVVMINPENGTGSVRSTGGQAREFAYMGGGGGQLDAAGFPLNKEGFLDFDNMLERIFFRFSHEYRLRRATEGQKQ